MAILFIVRTPNTLAQAPYRWSTFVGIPGGSGNVDGIGPSARMNGLTGIDVDSNGNVYVTDTYNHTIRKITASGVVSTFAGTASVPGSTDGTGSAARFRVPTGLAVDGSGNIFVADQVNHTIRKTTSAGVVTTLAGSAGNSGSADGTGTAARFYYPTDIALDGSGNLYVTDQYNHTVRKVTATGAVTTVAGLAGSNGSNDGTGSSARFFYPYGLTLDSSGNIIVTDTSNHTIRRITSAGVVTTLAGSAGAIGSANGTGSSARFRYPTGVVMLPSGSFVIADEGNSTLRDMTAAGVVSTLAGTAGLQGSTDASGVVARFNFPYGVATDGNGYIYVADTRNHTVRKISTGGAVTTLAGTAPNAGSTDGNPADARFNGPVGIALDSAGNFYVADQNSHTIRKVTKSGIVSTLAGLAGSSGSADGTGSNARFNSPTGVTVDQNGNVYVSDYRNFTIRKITASGVVTTLAGSAGVSGFSDGTGSAARFNSARSLIADGAGNLYVADGGNDVIRKVVIGTGAVTTPFGAAGDYSEVDGTGNTARFADPNGVALDANGNLYVVDFGGATVRRIVLATGAVTTHAGLAFTRGSVDGTGSSARFNGCTLLASDPAGNLSICDQYNRTMRRISTARAVTTIGGVAGQASSVDGIGTNTRFSEPSGAVVDAAGAVFFSDYYNNRIVRGISGPEINVQQPAGTSLASGNGVISAGSVVVGSSGTPITFTITNEGTTDLMGIGLTLVGSNPADFARSNPPVTTLAPAASTTFTVTFVPTASGVRTATLRVASNDGDENPFDITISGTGVAQSSPTATTAGATNVTLGSATLNGLVNANGINTSVSFQWGVSVPYANTVAATPGSTGGTTSVPVSASIAGLASAQTYHYRVVATSTTTTFGDDMTFTTGATPPTVTTNPATAIGSTAATLNGAVNPNGNATTANFQFGTTTAYGASISISTPLGSGSNVVSVSAPSTGLLPNQTYHFRLVASNSGGTVAGADQVFTTGAVVPTTTSQAPVSVTSTNVVLRGVVNPNGSSTSVHFLYGTPGNLIQVTSPDIDAGSGRQDQGVSAEISGLTPATQYQFEVVATNSAGSSTSPTQSFTTTPVVTAPQAFDDIAFVAQNTIILDVLENDTPKGGVDLSANGLSGAAVSDERAFITGGQRISFRPKLPNQLVNREQPFETLTYSVENNSGSDTAQVKVYYFTGLRGTYFRTLSSLGGSQRAFDLRTTLTSSSQLTGKLVWDENEYPLAYAVNQDGQVHMEMTKKGGDGRLVIELTLLPAPPNLHTFTGTFVDTSQAAPIEANFDLLFSEPSDRPPRKMLVSFIDPADVVGGASLPSQGSRRGVISMVPEGVGFARIKPTRNGSARFKTTMPDFASFTKGYPLIPANPGQGKLAGYEVAANPYGKNGGSVSGRAEVGYDGALAADSILADLDWARKPAAEMRRRHPGFLQGFNIAALLQGFTYSKPSAGIPIGFNTNPIGPNATLTLRGGNLPESPLSYPITIHNGRGEQSGPPDTASAPSQLGLKLKFTFSQGVFIGSFVHPRSGNRIKFIGGISSLERRCRGLFLSPEFLDSFGKNKNTGRVEITPRAP